MIQDAITVKIRKEVFWAVVCGMFVATAGLMFWLNYSFDRETKAVFAGVEQGVIRPPRPAIDTSVWKVYKNKNFGFSFKYPPELQPFSCYGQMLFCLNVGEKNLAFQDNGFAVRIYEKAKLQSRDEAGFSERTINGILWRFKAGDMQAFRTDFGGDKELRMFAGTQYQNLEGVIATFAFTR